MCDGERREGTTRRRILGSLGAAIVVGTSSGCLSLAGVRKTTEPIQFVSQTERIRATDATHVVRTETDLRDALTADNATVWLPDDVMIQFTGPTPIPIAANVTLASSRGLSGKTGALIESTDYHPTIFRSDNSGIRVTGLRVKGPETTYFDPREKPQPVSAYYSRAFEFVGDGIEIDHSELFGWTSAAVSLGAQNRPTGSRIHHNVIHHNQLETLGYGIDLRNGEHLIEWNYFDWNRHSIAGFGHQQNGYEARFNVVGPRAVSHAFDMHGLSENISGYTGSLAGKYIRVHHNVFSLTDTAAVVLRGASAQQSWVTNNWCAAVPFLSLHGRRSVIRQVSVDSTRRFRVADNNYGPRAAKQGRNRLTERATVMR